jgi:hypothetical protein
LNLIEHKTLTFLKKNWWHVILLIPGVTFITFLHEFAHAVAVKIQGGKVIEFVWFGDTNHWGHVRYSFPKGVEYNDMVISLAPYGSALVLFLIGCSLAFFFKDKIYLLSSFIFVWHIILPIAEIAHALLPYSFYNAENDFHHAFGISEWYYAFIALIYIILACLISYYKHKILFGSNAMPLIWFLCLSFFPVLLLSI